MQRTTRYSPLLPALLAVVVSPALAQQDNQTPIWEPVDQSVSDLDLRATSSRYVEQGIGEFGQSGGLYQRTGDDYLRFGPGADLNQQYQLRQPGYTAWIDKPDYLVNDPLGEMRLNVAPDRDRRFVDLIPPNTVFDLVPSSQAGFIPAYDTYNTDLGQNQINTRIDGYVGGSITGELTVKPLPPAPRAHRLPQHLIDQRQSRTRAELAESDHVTGDEQITDPEASSETEPGKD